jgi:hypothetical protein
MDIRQLVDIAQRVHDAEGMSFGSRTTREERNKNWARIIGIVHFGHPLHNPTPDPQWHLKDAGGGRPQSDDVAVSMPTREFWDCIPGCGADGYRFEASASHGALPPDQNVFPPPSPAGGGATTPPPPGAPPLSALHTASIQFFAARRTPARDRTWMKQLAEQMAHNFPGEGWGCKAADSTRPQSPNVLARETAGRLYGYDLLPGAGDVLVATATPMDLTGQQFIAVTPTDHVGPIAAPPGSPDAPGV